MTSPVPMGDGLVARRVRLRKEDVYVLGGILAGEDHLASIHGEASAEDAEGRVVVSIVTTRDRGDELDAWLEAIGGTLELEWVE